MNRYAVFHAKGSPEPNAFCFPPDATTRAINAAFAKDAAPHVVYEADSKADALAYAQEDAQTNALLRHYQEKP